MRLVVVMHPGRGRRTRPAQHLLRPRPNGLLVDTQPISAHPLVTSNGAELGALDMREWIETILAVDERVNEVIVTGPLRRDRRARTSRHEHLRRRPRLPR